MPSVHAGAAYAIGAVLLLLGLWHVAPPFALRVVPPESPELPCIDQLRVGENTDAGTCARECALNMAHDQVYCLPRAVVIGSAKCGTKEVQLWLKAHPKVHFASGEPNFFAFRPVDEFASTYLPLFPLDGAETPQQTVTMEKSPAYSQRFCTAAPRIKQLIPSVRLVYLLRDPVARAYSGFKQHCRHGRLVETATEVVRCDPSTRHDFGRERRRLVSRDGVSARSRAVPRGGASAQPRMQRRGVAHGAHLRDDRTTECRLPEGEAYDRLVLEECDAARFHKYLMGKQRRWQCAPVYRELSLSGNKSVHTLRGLYNDTCTPTEPYLEDDILSHGLYSLTIDEYLKHFDREQLHVGFHEQFVSEPSTFIGQIEDHMGVPRHDFKMHQVNGFWVLDSASARSKAVLHDNESHEPMLLESLRFLADFYADEVETLKGLYPEHQSHFDAWTQGWARKLLGA